MKLEEDFGVRALLATIALTLYELGGLYLLIFGEFSTTEKVAVLGMMGAPATGAIGFYFGTKVNQ